MMYRLLSVLGILLGNASGVDCFLRETKSICPGSSLYLHKSPYSIQSRHMNLFFNKDGVERIIASSTESLDPEYPFKNDEPYIPEVMKKHEGDYYWKMVNVGIRLSHIRLVLKDCSYPVELEYGDDFSLSVPADTSVLEFIPRDSDRQFVLWSRINAANQKGARGTVGYDEHWKAHRITQADEGSYTFLRESGGQITSSVVTVQGKKQHAHVNDENIKDVWRAEVSIPGHEVNIKYFPPADKEVMIFQEGVETEEGYRIFGKRIMLQGGSKLTKFTLTKVQPSDAGRYEILDSRGGLAMSMFLDRDPEFDPETLIMPLGISAGVIVGLLGCCWCCCKLCSDSDDDNTAASPEEELPVYVHDTVVLSGPGNPLQPSSPPRDPAPPSGNMSTSHPWENNPPPYSTVIPDQGPGDEGEPGPLRPSAPTPPPVYPAQDYQPIAWSRGLDDFLSHSPLSTETSATVPDDSSYNIDNLNF